MRPQGRVEELEQRGIKASYKRMEEENRPHYGFILGLSKGQLRWRSLYIKGHWLFKRQQCDP